VKARRARRTRAAGRAQRTKLRLTDCQPFPLAKGPRSFRRRTLIESVVVRHRLTLNVVLEVNTMRALKAYAMRTGAICFQFEIGTREEVEAGQLIALPLTDPDLRGGRLVFAARRAAIRRFRPAVSSRP